MACVMTVDLHSHILPGVDDGARDDAMSLEMLRIAAADGIRTIVATPHADRTDRDRIIRGVVALNALAQDDALDITILPGSELRASNDLAGHFRAGLVSTINQTRYMLVEMPLAGSWPAYVSQVMFDLEIAGAWPILAHAERYPAIQQHPALVADLVDLGVVIQINANSLTGEAGKRARKTAELLLTARLAHVIASDAHDLQVRPPRIAAAIERAEKIAGPGYAALMETLAAKIVRGEAIELPEPEPLSRRSLLKRIATRVVGHDT